MFDDPHKRTFFSAPQSVQSLIAAFLEPGITVLTFIIATLAAGEAMDRPALTLCLLVFALSFFVGLFRIVVADELVVSDRGVIDFYTVIGGHA